MEIIPNYSEKAKRDLELVIKAREGDQRAFAELMGNYRDSIYYILLKMVNNKDDAEDLTIESFGKAFRNLNQFSPEYAFSTWLFKIATNNGIDYLRSNRVKQKHIYIDQGDDETKDPIITLKTDDPDPEEIMISKQKEKMLHAIINQLNPTYRHIVELRYLQEYSYQEISEALNLPVGTVKARLHRSRELLLQIMRNNREGKELER